MQWQGGRRSTNIEDRRGMRVGPVGLVGGGLVGSVVLVLIGLFLGVDPSVLLNNVTVDEGGSSAPAATSPADKAAADFVATVVGYTEDTWSEIFRGEGGTYRPPTLVLFSGAVQSACGFGQAAMGPFYCSEDEKIYLDMSFFQELHNRFRAPGDFAEAYVIAHEVGHHVQKLLNISDQVEAVQRRARKAEANRASVQLELQADCFAGLWANRTQKAERSRLNEFLETGDVEEALRAASSIGDDKLQMQAQGYVVPESFTHGSAEQRMTWFKRGIDSGELSACNTFN
jgi:predicted metalloprotease